MQFVATRIGMATRASGRFPRRAQARRTLAIFAVACGGARSAKGAVQVWDPSGTTNSGGTAAWNTTSLFWDTGASTSTAWVNGNDAVFNGSAGTVTVDAVNGVTAHNVSIYSAGYTIGGGGTLTLTGSTPTFSYTAAAGTATVSAVLAGSLASSGGARFLGASSSYTFNVSGANTYSGPTTIQQCTFNFNTLAADGVNSAVGSTGAVYLGNASATNANYVGTGSAATNRLWAFNGSSTSVALNNNSDNTLGGAISFTNAGLAVVGPVQARSINLGGTYTASANSFAEAITDTGTGTSITTVNVKAGQWILSGVSNTYTGATVISSSTTLGGIGAHAFGSTSGITIPGSGTLSLLGDASTTFNKLSDGTLYSVTTTASGGTINVDEATAAGASTPRTMTIGNIGTTSVALSVAFNFNGADNTSLATGLITGPVSPSAGAVAIADKMLPTVGTVTIAGYNGSNSAGGETLSIGNVGNIIVTGPIKPSSTTLSLVKSGTGSVTLMSANPYTGGTNVSAGKLVLGSAGTLGTGPTVVNTTGILAGNGSTGGAVTVNAGGTITAGSGPTTADTIGLLTTLGQTWNSSGTYVAKVSDGAGNTNDTLVLSSLSVNATSAAPFNISLASQGSTTLTNTQQLVLAFIPGAAQGSFNVSSLSLATSNVTSTLGGVQLVDVAGTLNSVAGDELVAEAAVSATPEPTTALLLGSMMVPIALGRRRRRATRRRTPKV